MPANEQTQRTETGSAVTGIIGRLVVAAIILAVTAFLTPGFTISNIWSLIISAAVLSIIDYGIAKIFKVDATPFGRGILGFILAVIVIYATSFIVPGYSITLFGAIVAAIVFGIADAIIPGRAM